MPASTKKPEKEKVEEKESTIIHSKGTFMFPNGDKYSGDYVKLPEEALLTLRQGKGKHTTSDGMHYEGDWEEDKMHGKGKITYPSGAVYEGDFEKNCCHGYGKYFWPDGSWFEGTFRDNKMDGEGKFTDVNGQIWYGNFANKSALGLRFQLNM